MTSHICGGIKTAAEAPFSPYSQKPLTVKTILGVSMKRYFLHSSRCPDRGFQSKYDSKLSFFIPNLEIGKNRETFRKDLNFISDDVQFLIMYFLVKFRSCVSVFDKFTDPLLWERWIVELMANSVIAS